MITSQRITPTGPTRVLFTWTSDIPDALFYIYLNGEFETETRETSYEVTVPQVGQVQFEVLDDPADLPDEYYPPNFTLRWDGDEQTVLFRVERSVDAAWIALDSVPADDTRVFHYTTDVLEDSTVHQFRIVPFDAQGRSGVTLDLEAELCRRPDAPDVALSVVGNEIVISDN